jgi:hypothetical protein
MKCYYHRDIDAIGLCKSCSKGICPPCATDVGGGLACTASCIEEVKNINALIRSNTGATSVNRRAAYFWPVFLMVLGGLFVLAPALSGTPFQWFSLLSGAAFAFFGIILAVYQRAWQKPLKR